jgi:chorismate mutase/prephenate dehydratase
MRDPRRSSAPSGSDASEPELEDLRDAIDAVDREILERLNARARLVERVGRLKQERGQFVYRAGRERDLVDRLAAANPGPFPSDALAPVFREIISGTRSLEERLTVAFLGPEGTFSHLAVREQFGELAEPRPMATFTEVLGAVERGKTALAMLPLENTTEGVVTQTLDLLADTEAIICAELHLPVTQHLMSKSGRLEDVRRVASIPQALAQCRGWLDRHLPGVERVELASTAVAARLARREPDVAAVGSSIAADVNGLVIVEPSIQDRSENTTRFLVMGRDPAEPSGEDSTWVVYTVTKTRPGTLHALLDPFASRGVSLGSIHSRPIPGKPWEYLFFLELEGHRGDAAVAEAMGAAEGVAHSHRCLGSFPRARRASAGSR